MHALLFAAFAVWVATWPDMIRSEYISFPWWLMAILMAGVVVPGIAVSLLVATLVLLILRRWTRPWLAGQGACVVGISVVLAALAVWRSQSN